MIKIEMKVSKMNSETTAHDIRLWAIQKSSVQGCTMRHWPEIVHGPPTYAFM